MKTQNADQWIDSLANLLKGLINYLSTVNHSTLITIACLWLLVFAGLRLVRSIMSLFYFGGLVTIAVIAIDYMHKHPGK